MRRLDTTLPPLTPIGFSRRTLLKYCTAVASMLALPATAAPLLANRLKQGERPALIWLSFQECTGCTESFTRSHAPTIESLILDYLSLDYHHTLQAAAGEAAEEARREAMEHHRGRYLLVVDGSIPIADGGVYSTIAGRSNLDLLQECAGDAAAIIAIGSCAAHGGLPAAHPNPTGAVSVGELMARGEIASRPLVNLPGCPPIPITISSVLAHYLLFERFPDLDEQQRPRSFYGNTVHERCPRYHFYEQQKFALKFDDEGARKGWCLYKLGCRGPVTHNACAVYKWNQGTSFPIEAGHPCLGCSEPGFWDRDGFYRSLDDILPPAAPGNESAEAARDAGRQLYEENCIYCHSADPAQFDTPAEKIPELLRSGSIRSHRRLEFSDDQLEILQQFLKVRE
ncbi:MAG: hydrogenase small subunit [Sedimenticola sp.]|nr:hydrogenase small subunit [Sedimenticola sp.]